MNTIERNLLLTTLYQVTSKSDLLEQFDSKLLNAKGSTNQRYTFLLEQILFYSHAIIFGHGVQTAHNYRQSFIAKAKDSKRLKLSNEKIENAFSFLNRTAKWDFLSDMEKIEILKERQSKKPNARNASQLKKLEDNNINDLEHLSSDNEAVKTNDCEAKKEIKRLKEHLDLKLYEIPRGYEEGNEKGLTIDRLETYIKIALVALSTGAKLREIMEDLTISTKKGVIYFDDGLKQVKGVILELDARTVQSYLKAIRSHYKEQISHNVHIREKYQQSPTKQKDIKKHSKDISTGIRKAVKRLNIPNCQNTNHLNRLYKECLTSSTPK